MSNEDNADDGTWELVGKEVDEFKGSELYPIYRHIIGMRYHHTKEADEDITDLLHLLHTHLNERKSGATNSSNMIRRISDCMYGGSYCEKSADRLRIEFAGLFMPYDAGLIGLTDLSNDEVIDLIDHGILADEYNPYECNAVATAVLMSRERHNLPSDNIADASRIINNGLLGDWKTCLDIVNDHPWVISIIKERDMSEVFGEDSMLYIDTREHGNTILGMLHDDMHDISEDAWLGCSRLFMNDMESKNMTINQRYYTLSAQYLTDTFVNCLESQETSRDYGVFMRTMVGMRPFIAAAHGNDMVVIHKDKLRNMLVEAHDYPIEYIANAMMTNAVPVWSS